MKQEYVCVTRASLEGKAVFAVLPTGSERACMCFACLPAALDILKKALRMRLFYCIVVITPLIAITDKPGKMFLNFYRHTH